MASILSADPVVDQTSSDAEWRRDFGQIVRFEPSGVHDLLAIDLDLARQPGSKEADHQGVRERPWLAAEIANEADLHADCLPFAPFDRDDDGWSQSGIGVQATTGAPGGPLFGGQCSCSTAAPAKAIGSGPFDQLHTPSGQHPRVSVELRPETTQWLPFVAVGHIRQLVGTHPRRTEPRR